MPEEQLGFDNIRLRKLAFEQTVVGRLSIVAMPYHRIAVFAVLLALTTRQ